MGGLRAVLAGVVLVTMLAPGGASASAPPDPKSQSQDGMSLLGRAIGAGRAILSDVWDAGTAGLGPCSRRNLRLGEDGRLTILLLGSDYRRRPYIGERTDAILVITRRPSGRVVMASIPRDTSQFPRDAWNGGGTTGALRVNASYYFYKRRTQFGPTEIDCRALDRLRADVATALDTEIDHYAMVRFAPMTRLIDGIGPIHVDVPGPIIDPHLGRRGIYFPDRDDYRLRGRDECLPRPDLCRSALFYARSRAGTEAGRPNSDHRRSYRQQQIVWRTAIRVFGRGGGEPLADLLGSIRGAIYTDIPTTPAVAIRILDWIGTSTLGENDRIVFGGRKWTNVDEFTPPYSFRLDLPLVRDWVDRHFGS